MDDLREFLWAFASDWLALMTGAASILLQVGGFLWGAKTGNYWWIAAYFCFIVAAFRIWQLEHQKPGPQIIAVYETSNTEDPNRMSMGAYRQWRQAEPNGLGENTHPIIVRNLSDIPGINVQLQPITVGTLTANFPVLPNVIRGSDVEAQVSIDGVGPVWMHHFGVLLETALEGAQILEITIPLSISYSDIHGRKFQTECEVQYGIGHYKTVLRSYRRIGRRPTWLTGRD